MLARISIWYLTEVQQHSSGISTLFFFACLAVIVLGFCAVPIYQFWVTGGPIFYTTNVDEASHLSYWYANYVIEESGRLRASSQLVRWLHSVGFSGGYINVCMDILSTPLIALCFLRVYTKIGLTGGQARLASLLTFLFPLLFSCFNPAMAALNDVRLETELVKWISNPQNSEVLFLRSPEPQMSWVLLALVAAFSASPIILAFAGLLISPLLYPFVRLPVLFLSFTILSSTKIGYRWGAVASFLVLSLITMMFVHNYAERSLLQFFIFSHLPVLPITGLLSLLLVFGLTRGGRFPHRLANMCWLIVASIWAAENVQIISGWLVTPVNFEQYWGVFVLGVLAALFVTFVSSHSTLWLAIAMIGYILHATVLFRTNIEVFRALNNQRAVFSALSDSPNRVVCNNLYLATYLDLAFPKQAPTALSWTRTLHAGNNDNYRSYICMKEALQSLPQRDVSSFKDVFSQLEDGYLVKGSDLNVTMRRREIVHFPLPDVDITNCPRIDYVTNLSPAQPMAPSHVP